MTKAFLKAPESERGATQSATKYTTLKKRQRAPVSATQPDQQIAPPTSETFEFRSGDQPEEPTPDDTATLKTLMHSVLADNLDLRRQVFVLASQIATLQTGMDTQLRSVVAQMANLS